MNYKIGFFETEAGEVFYNYRIEKDITDIQYRKSTVAFNTSEVLQIDIYGRKFDANEFISYPSLYEKVKGQKSTDDVFFFRCNDGDGFIIAFHPLMPRIEVYFSKTKMESFWNEYKDKYELHYTLT